MKLFAALAVSAALAGLAGSQASAETFIFDISGISTNAEFGAAFPTLTYDFAIAGTVTSVEFDVNYEAFAPSRRDDVIIAIDTDADSSADGDIDMFDFGAPASPGIHSAAGLITANTYSPNGLVYLTAFEFINHSVTPDATFGANSWVRVNFSPVPAPSSLAVLGLPSLIGVGIIFRRRRK